MNTGEIWRSVPGYEGLYSVSNLGLVISHARLVEQPWRGRLIPRLRPQRILAAGLSAHGYPVVGLTVKAKTKSFTTGRLVLLAFVGPLPPGKEMCHGDGDRTNSNLDNLRYDSPKANAADRARHGRTARANAKLLPVEIEAIRADARPRPVVAADYGISLAHVFKIRARKAWAGV